MTGLETRGASVVFGRGRRTVRNSAFSAIVNTRVGGTVAVSAVVCAVALVVALCSGALPLAPTEVWSALLGHATPFTTKVVVEWRLPRAVAAIVFGAAAALTGALVQSLTRNPLGSPDVIGLNAGAYTGALVGITAFGGAVLAVTTGAFIGGIATALLVWGLSAGRGRTGDAFVIVGVGIASALTAVNSIIVLRATTAVATRATVWGQGSLDEVRWPQLTAICAVLIVLAPFVVVAASSVRSFELGDDLASGLGVRIGVARGTMLTVAVLITAAVTSVAGPIMFLALVSPHLARFVTRSAGTTLVGSAAVGAALLSVSDLVAQYALPEPVPVGVVTVVAGGGYFIVLLVQRLKKG
ncbi:iron chelate uptake ABC transporter family permease subunit [Curtobacterium sp. 18060]|uniref:FecCD family ABC transporter permease n=1 Tax=Curtobacterium sp. 18060 TaxID=2681408 RepID=UPI00135B9EF0|nr:iron chelate uptake ABC transporter family permease subunit [Curtobacterium sp. 18060]